jgi:hypothetical protein
MKAIRWFKIALFLCLVFMPVATLRPLHAQDIPGAGVRIVQVIGSARTTSSDLEKAREEAVANGLVQAVSVTAGDILSQEGLVKYFPELNQNLFNNIQVYIQNYQILAESMADNAYRVVLEATVSVDILEKYLSGAGFVSSRKTLPKILFLISEKTSIDNTPRFWWGGLDSIFFTAHCETAMIKTMDESGFTIVSHQNPEITSDLPPMDQNVRLTNEEAVFIGVKTQADILVVGEALVDITPNVMGDDKRTFKATVSVRAIRSDTGQQVAQAHQTAVTVDADENKANAEVLTQAGQLAAKEIATQLAASSQEAPKGPDQIVLSIEGTSDLGRFVFFRKSLNELTGVKSIFIREMKSDQAEILVNYEGSAEQLAESLMKKTYETFGINIYDITPEMLRIKLMKK